MRRKKNLILISLDTLRADVAYSGRLTAFEHLRAYGTSFVNTISSAPLTPVSHASIFTGLQPYEHGLRHLLRERLISPLPTLAELMTNNGYATGAVVSCPGMNRWYGFARGFRHYDDEVPRLPDGRDPLEVCDVEVRGCALKRAPLVVERALTWLKANREQPFFLFVHFFDTHWPYEAPQTFGPSDANPYEQEAHFVDHYLGELIDQILLWKLFDDTVFVVLSDHGEDLGGWYVNDHGGEKLGHREEKGHGCLLHDATQMVPLLFIARDAIPSAVSVRPQVRLVDVFPTIAELLGISDFEKRSGHSLVEFFSGRGSDRIAYSETYYREEQALSPQGVPGLGPIHALRFENRSKIILDVQSNQIAAYDLTSDPNEKAPIGLFGRVDSMSREPANLVHL